MTLLRSTSLLLLMLFPLIPMAQVDMYGIEIGEEEEAFIRSQLEETVWGNGKSLYKAIVPKQFSDAHAVYLEKSVSREYYRNARNALRTINLERNVILLRDAEGVLEHSLFTFQHIEHEYAFDVTALKVIKPDGREIIHSIKPEEENADKNTRGLYRLAIPGLEPGDIIDYYYYIEFRVLFPQEYSRIFDAVYWLAGESYPVLNYHLNFTLGPSAFINVTAERMPEPVETSIKTDKKTFNRYTYSLYNLSSAKDHLPFYYPFREVPAMKYQVFVGPYLGNSDIRYNLAGSMKMNHEIRPSRLQDYMQFALTPGRDYKIYYGEFRQFLRHQHFRLKKTQKSELVEHFYDFTTMRSDLNRLLEGEEWMEERVFPSYAHYVLEKLGVNYDVVLAVDRSVSSPENYLLADEIHPVIRILEGDTTYLSAPARHLQAGEVPALYREIKATTYDPATRKLSEAFIPGTDSSVNRLERKYRVAIASPDSISVSVEGIATGYERRSAEMAHQNRALDYLGKGAQELAVLSAVASSDKLERKQRSILETLAEKREEEIALQRQQQLEENADARISDYRHYYSTDKKERRAEWKESYILHDASERAENNYILDLARIHEWPELPTLPQQTREADIYLDYPLTRSFETTLIPPDGYELLLPEGLDKVLRNSAGTSSVQVRPSGPGWKITASYSINSIELEAAQWNEFTELIDTFEKASAIRLLIRSK